MLDAETQTTLNDVRSHWEEAYKINCKDGVWSASPLWEPSVIIERATPGELREALRLNYAERSGRRTAGGCST